MKKLASLIIAVSILSRRRHGRIPRRREAHHRHFGPRVGIHFGWSGHGWRRHGWRRALPGALRDPLEVHITGVS